jgi:SAM-dependent methyltransferase
MAAASPPSPPRTYLDANRLWVDSRLRALVALGVEGPGLQRLGARGSRCVEIGTGRRALGARVALTRLGATEVRAFDLYPATIARARQRTADLGDRLRLQVCDATCLPVATGSVDLVVDFHALHHIEDWRAAVRECARMLRPGGVLALTEMTRRFVDAPWLRAVSRHPADRFDTDELLAELRGSGLEVGPDDVRRRAGDRWVLAVARRA